MTLPDPETILPHRGRWKLIEGLGAGGFTAPKRVKDAPPDAGQLYDLHDDPGERHDRFDERPEVVTELRRILDEVRARSAIPSNAP